MKKVNQGGVQLTSQDKADLIAFLRSLSDPNFGQGIGPGD
jgi:cytochrome c peroxidase